MENPQPASQMVKVEDGLIRFMLSKVSQTVFNCSLPGVYLIKCRLLVILSKLILTIGCYKDTSNRAIPTLEGQDSILDGSYTARKDPIEKCYQAAKKRGFHVFAVQDGGQCAASSSAAKTFDKYGKSSACKSDGEGGPWANQVYYIKGKRTVTVMCSIASDDIV